MIYPLLALLGISRHHCVKAIFISFITQYLYDITATAATRRDMNNITVCVLCVTLSRNNTQHCSHLTAEILIFINLAKKKNKARNVERDLSKV